MKPLFVLGTRPEVIKLAPVIKEAREQGHDARVLSTRQHTDLIAEYMGFSIKPDMELDVLGEGRTPVDILGLTARGIQNYCKREQPDAIIVQGDTSTTLGGALAGFHVGVPVAHIEAGLRSGNDNDPFPEEMNRKLVAQLARWHFAPALRGQLNLLEEGIPAGRIHVVGNPVYEAIKMVEEIIPDVNLDADYRDVKHVILVTCHRRENWGIRLNNIVEALESILVARNDVAFVIPQHPNPRVRQAFKALDGMDRVFLWEPLQYPEMLGWIKTCSLLMTDSGGLVEEAPYFKRHTLVLRETTERQEVIGNSATLVGTNTSRIVKETLIALEQLERGDLPVFAPPYYVPDVSKNIINQLTEDLSI